MVNAPLAHSDKQSNFMKNSKKFHKSHIKSTSRPPHYPPSSDDVSTSTMTIDTRPCDINATLLVETAPPAIAIVAPTARNPTTAAVNSISHLKQPCKAHGQSQQIATRIINIQPIHHHIQQVPISTQQQQPPPQVTAWVEPAFNFGPGFVEMPQFCPTHSRPHENVVLFHLQHGIAASFQIAGLQKIFQGESAFFFLHNRPFDDPGWDRITEQKKNFFAIALHDESERDYPAGKAEREWTENRKL